MSARSACSNVPSCQAQGKICCAVPLQVRLPGCNKSGSIISVVYVCQDPLQKTQACYASEPRSPSWCCTPAALQGWRRQPCG